MRGRAGAPRVQHVDGGASGPQPAEDGGARQTAPGSPGGVRTLAKTHGEICTACRRDHGVSDRQSRLRLRTPRVPALRLDEPHQAACEHGFLNDRGGVSALAVSPRNTACACLGKAKCHKECAKRIAATTRMARSGAYPSLFVARGIEHLSAKDVVDEERVAECQRQGNQAGSPEHEPGAFRRGGSFGNRD
jgi:hypothetical protein